VRAQLRTLLGQTAVYGLGGGVGQAIGVLTLPVFARALNSAEYGALELYTVGIAVAIVFVDAGMSAAAQRSFYDYRDEQLTDRRAVITTAFVTSTGVSALAAAAIYSARDPLANWLFEGQPDPSLVALAALTLPLLAVANMTREVMRLTLQPWRYVASSLIATIGGAGISVYAVTSLDAGVKGILTATLIGTAAAAVYGVGVARTYLRGHYDWAKLRTMLRYGLPLIPGLVALWATAYADRLLLANLENLEAVGLYAIASRFAAPIVLLLTAFVTAYQPFLLALRVEDPVLESELRGRIASLTAVALLGAGLPLAVFGPELISIVTPGYDGAAPAISPLVLGTAAYGVASVFLAPLLIHRRTDVSATLTVVMGVSNVALCVLLIPPFGLVGAAIASFAGYALLAVLYWWWGRRLDDAPYEPVHLVVAFALAAVAGEAWRIDLSSEALTLLLKFAVCAAFLIGLRLTHVIRPEDLGAVREIAERRVRTRGDAA
jgi:O-antigen/teichoic acid export membrane protein